jgi:ATP/maltotriose-dependent transcriptional regulator MalT
MSSSPGFAELWNQNDPATVETVETAVKAEVLKALHRKLGASVHWIDLEGNVRSAQRTGIRRLQSGEDPRLAAAQTQEQFMGWLLITSLYKSIRDLRKLNIERNHRERVKSFLDLFRSTGTEHDIEVETADEVADRLRTVLDEKEMVVVLAKLRGCSEVEIAEQLDCSTRTVRMVWAKICEKLKRLYHDLNC